MANYADIPIELTKDITKDQLISFPAFKVWFNTLQHSLALQKQESHAFYTSPYTLKSITVQSVDHFGGGRLGFVKLKTEVSNKDNESLPGSVFLRGGSVCMLLILQPDDVPEGLEQDKHVILTVQPRIAAGSLSFVELPAGMVDDSGTFSGAAAKEIKEETGLEIEDSSLINLTELAMLNSDYSEELQNGVYPSPGGCDEFIPVFLHSQRIPREQLKEWEGKLTGLREHGEKITLKLCKLDELWKVGARDGKTLAAWALYDGLKREGKI